MNWKKIFTIAALTGFSASVATGQGTAPTIVQGDYISNVFGNSNFIKNPNAKLNAKDVTVSSATVSRSATTPLVATSEFNVAVTLANGTATWATRAFDAGMKNQNCEARFTYRGFQSTSKAHIKQGANTVATLNLSATGTDPRIASINFPCGDLSQPTTFVVTDTAILAGTNEIGGIYVGLATNQANVAQASKVGGWDSFLCGGEPTLTTGTGVWSAPNVAGSCSGTPVGLASAALSNLNTLTFGFSNLPPGEYVFMIPAYVYPGTVTSGTARCDGRIKETTLSLLDNGNSFGLGSTTSQFSIGQITQFKFQNTVTANRIFQIELNRSNGLGNCNAGTLNFQQNVSLYRFPTSSELVVTPERQNVWGSVNYTGTAGSLTVRSGQAASNTFDTFSGAGFTSARTLKGKCKAPVSGDNVGCQIENMPVGNYEVSVSGLMFQDPGTTTVACSHRIFETTTSTQVASHTSSRIAASGGLLYQGRTIKGVFNNTAVANRNFVIQAAKGFIADSSTQGQCLLFINTSGDISDVNVTVTPLDQPSNSALYVQGPVQGSNTNTAIPTNSIGGKVIDASLAKTTTGLGTWQVASGNFGTPPAGSYLMIMNSVGTQTAGLTGTGSIINESGSSVTPVVCQLNSVNGSAVDTVYGRVCYYTTDGTKTLYAWAQVTGANTTVTTGLILVRLN
jgi:hypothetical protein